MIESRREGWKERFCTVRTHLAFSWHICFTSEESKQNKTVPTKPRDERTRHERYGRLKCQSSTEAFEDFTTCQPPYRQWRSQSNGAVQSQTDGTIMEHPPKTFVYCTCSERVKSHWCLLFFSQTTTCYRGWTYYSTACIIYSLFHILFWLINSFYGFTSLFQQVWLSFVASIFKTQLLFVCM